MPSTTLYLVRHGQAQPDGVDPALSALGREQASLLARRMVSVPFTSVCHSPKRRAAETCRILFEHGIDAAAEQEDLIDDRTPFPTDIAQAPPAYRDRLQAIPESVRDVGAVRLREAVRTLGAIGPPDRAVLAVTHAFVIGWFVRHALDAPDWRWIGLNPANCSLTEIRVADTGEHRLISYNDTSHLAE